MAITEETAQVPKAFKATMRAFARHVPTRMGQVRRMGREIRALAHSPKRR